VLITDATGGRVLDLMVPGGAFDPVAKVGWNASPRGNAWKYVNRSAAPPAGVTGVAIRDLSKKTPGLVQFSVRGRLGSYPVDPTKLPLTGLLVIDPPTAETGQCARATFDGPPPRCKADRASVRCR
jgi:hypothetical protein